MDAKEFVQSLPCTEGTTPAKYAVGSRVVLELAEGHDANEIGEVLSYDWMSDEYIYVVEVETTEEGDDGLRELSEDQIVGFANKVIN